MENEITIDKMVANLVVVVRAEIKKNLPNKIPETPEEKRNAIAEIIATIMATTETFLTVMLHDNKERMRDLLQMWIVRLDDEIKVEEEANQK